VSETGRCLVKAEGGGRLLGVFCARCPSAGRRGSCSGSDRLMARACEQLGEWPKRRLENPGVML
jgi:hypothetical protein